MGDMEHGAYGELGGDMQHGTEADQVHTWEHSHMDTGTQQMQMVN